MPTTDEIKTEWKSLRPAIGNLLCYIDGKMAKIESLKDLELSWKKGYDCGYKDGMKARIASVEIDGRSIVRAKWSDVQVAFSNDTDMQIASMLCGNCNRWHNEIYHYGNPIELAHFCSFCVADMEGGNG